MKRPVFPPGSALRAAAGLALVVVLLGGGGVPAYATGGKVLAVKATDTKILAEGGSTTVTVTVSGLESGADVIITTTLGAFGAPSGPSRFVSPLPPAAGGESTLTTELYGDGRAGTAVITAQVAGSTRSTAVLMVGPPVSIEFETPAVGAVLPAAAPVAVTVQLRDAIGVTVPDTAVEFATSIGEIVTGAVGVQTGALMTTDRNGRASASLRAAPGVVRLTATADEVVATRMVTLHGPAVTLELIAIHDSVSPGEAPPGTLVAILLDDGGRPVPRARIEFTTDREDATIVHTEEGETPVTDNAGRATGHLLLDLDAPSGALAVTAEAGGLTGAVELLVVGPPSQVRLGFNASGIGAYEITADVLDLADFPVPAGYTVHWSATGVSADVDQVTLDPVDSPVEDGVAVTTVVVPVPSFSSVRVVARVVRAGLEGEELATALASAPTNGLELPLEAIIPGIPLASGLNRVRWIEDPATISTILSPIAQRVIAAWVLHDSVWLGYFPRLAMGVNFAVQSGDELYLFLTAAAALEGVEGLGASP